MIAMKKPEHLDPLAEQVLDKLAGHSESGEIVLGGYFALKHYLDYRSTHDIDAWWKGRASAQTETAIRQSMSEVASANSLLLQEKKFGETVSFECLRDRRRVFSFQIALRSVELEPAVLSPWPPILIETLADNAGAKMNALVDRGAPRDFVDIRQLVDSGLLTARRCWELWHAKNPGADPQLAYDKVRIHLATLEARRPLATIQDGQERRRAEETRNWFRDVFLTA
jgi:hypothetical protein